MTTGERLVSSLKLKDRFHDSHERRSYLRMVEVAKRIVDNPSLLANGRAFLERFTRASPHQLASYDLWTKTLELPPEEIARSLLADDERGALLRDSAPVFIVLSREEVRHLWASAR